MYVKYVNKRYIVVCHSFAFSKTLKNSSTSKTFKISEHTADMALNVPYTIFISESTKSIKNIEKQMFSHQKAILQTQTTTTFMDILCNNKTSKQRVA